MPSVLFVCMANRFRSPLAAAVFRKALDDRPQPGSWQVSSAGTWAVPGLPVLPQMQQAAHDLGLDLSAHRSAQLVRGHLADNDLVLVMQSGQREALLCEFPGFDESLQLLSQAAEGHTYDIPDAVGSRQEMTELVMELDSLIRAGLPSICALAVRLQDSRSRPLRSAPPCGVT
jgi:protein-tyrosine-phosphatase